MPALTLFAFGALVIATSFLSGIFGMAGGMILMGVLLFYVGVADAMILHGVTQFVSNAGRAAMWYRHVDWRVVARFSLGLLLVSAVFVLVRFSPDQRLVFIALGLSPFLAIALPARFVPQVHQRFGAELSGVLCTVFLLTSGLSGPLLDMFYVRSELDRRMVVATKAVCQALSHVCKLIYFGLLVEGATALATDPLILGLAVIGAIIGTTSSRRVLEAMSNSNFRRYTLWIVLTLGAVYLVRGGLGYL